MTTRMMYVSIVKAPTADEEVIEPTDYTVTFGDYYSSKLVYDVANSGTGTITPDFDALAYISIPYLSSLGTNVEFKVIVRPYSYPSITDWTVETVVLVVNGESFTLVYDRDGNSYVTFLLSGTIDYSFDVAEGDEVTIDMDFSWLTTDDIVEV